MKKVLNSKVFVIFLSMVLIFSMTVACGSDKDKESTTDETPVTEGESEEKEKEKEEKEERITLTLFMGNSGLQAPDGVDLNDNKFINIIKDYANVDLEVECPLYTDYNTKFNLLLSSGDLPDIVHAQSAGEALKRGDEGAFIDLYEYWENSPVIQKYIDETMMEIAKSPKGGYYRIPMKYNNAYEGSGIIARYDLIAKYNDNKWPETVEDWIEIARKLKADDPDAIPFSMRADAGRFSNYGGAVFPFLYGAYTNRWDYEENKVYAQIQLPEFKAALETMAQLYEEGLLDPEFSTTDSPSWFAKKADNSVLAEVNNMNQTLPASHSIYRNSTEFPEQNTWEWLVAPPLKKYPSVVKDPKYTEPFSDSPISDHGMFISSSCKEPDRAWKVIEGFACDELFERIFWGWEGETYKIENGKKIPDIDALMDLEKHRWGLAYATIFGFNNGQEVSEVGAVTSLGEEFFNKVKNNILPVDKVARNNGISPLAYVQLSEDVVKKSAEAADMAFAIATEYVMGRIDSSQYDERVSEWTKNYGFIYEEMTEYILENKEELESKGVRFDR